MPDTSRELSRPLRVASFALGLGGGGAGVAAVFGTGNEVGSGALLLLGTVLILIGMAGRLPATFKAGDYEMSFPSAADGAAAVAQAVEVAAAEEGAQAQDVAQAARDASNAVASLRSSQIDSEVTRLLTQGKRRGFAKMTREQRAFMLAHWDLTQRFRELLIAEGRLEDDQGPTSNAGDYEE